MKTLLSLLIDAHLHIIALRNTLAIREREQRDLVQTLVCSQDMPELSIIRHGGKTYHLVADLEEGHHITVTQIHDLGETGDPQ